MRILSLCFILTLCTLVYSMDYGELVTQLPAASKKEHTGEDCPICWDEHNRKPTITLSCFHTHTFHRECLKNFFDTQRYKNISCPLCKKELTALEKWEITGIITCAPDCTVV